VGVWCLCGADMRDGSGGEQRQQSTIRFFLFSMGLENLCIVMTPNILQPAPDADLAATLQMSDKARQFVGNLITGWK